MNHPGEIVNSARMPSQLPLMMSWSVTAESCLAHWCESSPLMEYLRDRLYVPSATMRLEYTLPEFGTPLFSTLSLS